MASPTGHGHRHCLSAPLDLISTFSSSQQQRSVELELEPGGMEAGGMEVPEVAAVVGMVAARLDAEDYDDHEGITEESVAELMRWFELEIKLAAGANALPPPPPTTTTVGARKESCCPSLSRPSATVIASVDGRAGAPPPLALAEPWPWRWPVPEPAAGEQEEEEEDVDDEWVLQLLTDGPDGDQ